MEKKAQSATNYSSLIFSMFMKFDAESEVGCEFGADVVEHRVRGFV